MLATPITIEGNEYKLSGTLVTPDNTITKLPAVVFYHGMPSQSKPRHVERAKRVAEQGIAGLAFDFRGCGESEGKLTEMKIADWIDDALLAFDYLAKQPFVDLNRIGISGKSFGGYAGAIASAQRNVRSMVFHAPAVFKDEWFNQTFQWTPEFQQERLEYRQTPEALDNKAIAAIQQFNNALLLIGSEFDEFCPKPVIEKYFDVCPSKNKKLVWLKGADHYLHDERQNEEYIKMMVDWFKKTL